MKIGLHGGNCCGIKTIYALGSYPEVMAAARKPLTKSKTSFGQYWSSGDNDMLHSAVNRRGKCDFFNEEAPKETYEKRFNRMVNFIKKHRAHGIIEVTLSGSQKLWKPVLEKKGFKEGVSAKNSNTGATITVYHLSY